MLTSDVDSVNSGQSGYSGLIVHLARLVSILVLAYIAFLVSLMLPPVQRFTLAVTCTASTTLLSAIVAEVQILRTPSTLLSFMASRVRRPFHLVNPSLVDALDECMTANRVRNFYIRTPDGISIGVWQVLPATYSAKWSMTETIPDEAFDVALRSSGHYTMLYCHGNAATRVTGHRRHLARHVSSGVLNMNFIIFDYRGFADSSNVEPSEEGLLIDAKAVWDWLTEDKQVPAKQIIVAGQSLGTGVACALAGRALASEGIVPAAVFLTAPFTSILDLLLTYKLGEVVPVLQPLRYFGLARNFLFSFLETRFDSRSVIAHIRCPVLIIHSLSDGSILHSHSRALFDTLCTSRSSTDGTIGIVTERLGVYAILKIAKRQLSENPVRSVTAYHLELHHGGHSDVGYSEIALSIMKRVLEDANSI